MQPWSPTEVVFSFKKTSGARMWIFAKWKTSWNFSGRGRRARALYWRARALPWGPIVIFCQLWSPFRVGQARSLQNKDFRLEYRKRGEHEGKKQESRRKRSSRRSFYLFFIFVFFLSESLEFCIRLLSELYIISTYLFIFIFLLCFQLDPWWRLVRLWAKRCHGVLMEFSMEFSSSMP